MSVSNVKRTLAANSFFTNSCNPNFALAWSGKSMALVGQPAPSGGDETRRHGTLARVAMDAAASGASAPDENAAAYGEVVWSWRRDPGVYPPRPCGDGNGGNKGRSPGRARSKPQNHCAGKAGMSRLYLSNPCAFYHYFSTRRCGRSRRPAFPAPSAQWRANEIAKPGRNAPREQCFTPSAL